MELKVGMYVRTKDKKDRQFIRKIVDLPKDARYGSIVVDKDIHNVEWVSTKNVLNASYNLIDLIEIGDYVNGMEVIAKDSDNRLYVPNDLGGPYDREFYNGCFEYTLLEVENFKIKNIVTKEQFESIKYEVE